MRKNIKKNKTEALTLIELIAVVIIIGILATISSPQFFRARERSMDKHAQVILDLIRAGERRCYVQMSFFFPQPPGASVTDLAAINGNLSLDLVDDGNWQYLVANTGTALIGGFNANLTRRTGWGYDRTWWINDTMINASCVGNCP